MFFAGTFSITSNSRMMYAFARDGALPGSKVFQQVDPKRKTPVRTGAKLHYSLYFVPNKAVFFQFGSPSRSVLYWHYHLSEAQWPSPLQPASLPSDYIYHMVRSVLLPGHYSVSPMPGIPVALRVIYYKDFKKGPFHLGKLSLPVGIVAVIWIIFIAIVFILPQVNPVNSQTLNYSIVAVGIVMTYSLTFWLASARKWFTGPIQQIKGRVNDLL